MSLIQAQGLTKRYRSGDGEVGALCDATFVIEPGESVAIMGPSGSGKSTLMNLLGCLDSPSAGRYRFDGHEVVGLSRAELAAFRNRHIGFVFQGFNLLARATALQNVELPMIYAGEPASARRRRATDLLEAVGLADRAGHLPSQLSGGQQQRVAIARALANRPRLLLADEPTGALDTGTGETVMRMLGDINAQGVTVVVVTHDPQVATAMRRLITMRDGRLAADTAARATLCEVSPDRRAG